MEYRGGHERPSNGGCLYIAFAIIAIVVILVSIYMGSSR